METRKPEQPDHTGRLLRTLSRAVFCLCAIFPGHLPAQDEPDGPRWYLGGGLTYTGVTSGSFGGLNDATDQKDSDTGIVLTGGYRFGRNLAAEIGYSDAGRPEYRARRGLLCAEPNLCNVDVTQDTAALTVAAVGILPLGRIWEIYGRAGVAFWDATAERSFRSPSGAFSTTDRLALDGTDLLVGAGVGALLSPRLALRLDYSWFDTDDALLAVDRAAGFEQFAFEAHWRF